MMNCENAWHTSAPARMVQRCPECTSLVVMERMGDLAAVDVLAEALFRTQSAQGFTGIQQAGPITGDNRSREAQVTVVIGGMTFRLSVEEL